MLLVKHRERREIETDERVSDKQRESDGWTESDRATEKEKETEAEGVGAQREQRAGEMGRRRHDADTDAQREMQRKRQRQRDAKGAGEGEGDRDRQAGRQSDRQDMAQKKVYTNSDNAPILSVFLAGTPLHLPTRHVRQQDK